MRRMNLLLARLRDDRGNIGVLMALVLFTIIGSLCMTWNTAQLSKEKMRLQNAADSAALGFCTWQARGMNAVQNINDEMFMSLGMAISLQKLTIGLEATAQTFDRMGLFPLTRWLKAVGLIFHAMGLLCGGTSGILATKVVPWVLVPAGFFYAYGSCALGYLDAQQLAAMNRADPLGNVDISMGGFGKLGLFAVGFAYPFLDTVKLPLVRKEITGEPWTPNAATAKSCKRICEDAGSLWRRLYKVCGTGDSWKIQPWISPLVDEKDDQGKVKKVPRRPGPAIFIAHKYGGHIETIDLGLWMKESKSRGASKMPMFAIAAAQCITGDVIEASKDPKVGYPRGRGHGAGATAKLVSVAYAFGRMNATLGKIMGAAIYH